MDNAADYDAARAYGHAILDAVSASEVDDDGKVMDFAAQRALEVDAVRVTTDDSDDSVVRVDLSAALGGTLILVQALVTALQIETGEDSAVIIANARERFDRACRI